MHHHHARSAIRADLAKHGMPITHNTRVFARIRRLKLEDWDA
jgi:predicted nucleic acid-binding protein